MKQKWINQNRLKFIDQFIIQECGQILVEKLNDIPEQARPEDRMIALGPKTVEAARYILNRSRALELDLDESDEEMMYALVRVVTAPDYV